MSGGSVRQTRDPAQTPAGEGIDEQCHPWAPQNATGTGTDQFHVQLRMVDMTDLEWPVAVARSRRIQLPIEGLVCVGRAAALAFQDVFKGRTLPHGPAEGDIAWCHRSFFLTSVM